jgi:hypothetical protein
MRPVFLALALAALSLCSAGCGGQSSSTVTVTAPGAPPGAPPLRPRRAGSSQPRTPAPAPLAAARRPVAPALTGRKPLTDQAPLSGQALTEARYGGQLP